MVGRSLLVLAVVLASSRAVAKPTQQCVELRILHALANADETLSDEDKAIIEAALAVRCASREEPESWDWSNGKPARRSSGSWDYPTGVYAKRPSTTSWDYPNGRYAKQISGAWDYPNGNYARNTSGNYELPDGTSTTQAGMLETICRLAPKKCNANMKAYKARRGDSRMAWLVSTLYALWTKAQAQ